MKNILTVAFAAALLTLGRTVQAQIILGQDYTAYLTDPANSTYTVQTVYNVAESAGVYTYTYNFTVGTGVGLAFAGGGYSSNRV